MPDSPERRRSRRGAPPREGIRAPACRSRTAAAGKQDRFAGADVGVAGVQRLPVGRRPVVEQVHTRVELENGFLVAVRRARVAVARRDPDVPRRVDGRSVPRPPDRAFVRARVHLEGPGRSAGLGNGDEPAVIRAAVPVIAPVSEMIWPLSSAGRWSWSAGTSPGGSTSTGKPATALPLARLKAYSSCWMVLPVKVSATRTRGWCRIAHRGGGDADRRRDVPALGVRPGTRRRHRRPRTRLPHHLPGRLARRPHLVALGGDDHQPVVHERLAPDGAAHIRRGPSRSERQRAHAARVNPGTRRVVAVGRPVGAGRGRRPGKEQRDEERQSPRTGPERHRAGFSGTSRRWVASGGLRRETLQRRTRNDGERSCAYVSPPGQTGRGREISLGCTPSRSCASSVP